MERPSREFGAAAPLRDVVIVVAALSPRDSDLDQLFRVRTSF